MRWRFLCVAVCTCLIAWLGQIAQTHAFTGAEFERKVDEYAAALRARFGSSQGDIKPRLQARAKALEGENWPEAVKLSEEIVGRALGGQRNTGETIGESWLALAKAWKGHAPRGSEGLWSAFRASRSQPTLRVEKRAEALDVAGSILLEQLEAHKTDFAFRTETLRKIGVRLADDDYDEARIQTERRHDILPAQIRELTDLRQREEHERTITIDSLTVAIASANQVYRELSQLGRSNEREEDFKKAAATRLLTVNRIFADARSDRAAICAEFNLPLRRDAGQFVAAFAMPRTSAEKLSLERPVSTDRTVNEGMVCIHGLQHGYHYHVLLRQGLPARSGAMLIEDFDTRKGEAEEKSGSPGADDGEAVSPSTYKNGIRVPDRVSTAGFRSSAFILPREGGGSIPLMTVNLDQVDVDLARLSDRTLYRRIALGQIGNFIDYEEFDDLKRHFSDPLWSGIARTENVQNKTVTTDIPVRQLLDERNRIIRSLAGAPLDTPHRSEEITTGRLHGRFRVEKLSEGASELPRDEPGVYAFVAKVMYNDYSHFLGDRPEVAEYDSDSTYSGMRRRDRLSKLRYGQQEGTQAKWSRGSSQCSDQSSGREVACLVSVQWFVITDIGLSFYQGPDELYVIARSLGTGKAAAGTRVELVTASNRVLASAMTDASGVAKFRSALTRGSDGNRLAAIMAYNGADFSFIDYKRDAFDLSDHGVGGRRPPKNYDVYVYTDRGIYRPEETVNATILVRDTEGSAPGRIPPVTIKLRPSSGVIAAEQRPSPESWKLGGNTIPIAIPKTTALGAADILVYLGDSDQLIGSATIQIDHFRPDRARVSLVDANQWQIATLPDQRVSVKGRGAVNFLYGMHTPDGRHTDAPGAGLTGEVSILFQRATSPVPGCYADFHFDRTDEEFTPLLHRLMLPDRTDAKGEIAIETTARLPKSDHPIEALVALTVFDEAGKVGVQSLRLPVPLQRPWLGLRHEARLIDGREGSFRLGFAFLALSADNRARSALVNYKIYRERNSYVWHQQSNSWKFQHDVERVLAAEGRLQTGESGERDGSCARANGRVDVELPLGRYYVLLEDEGGRSISQRIDAGWSSTDIRTPTPDRLTLHADAPRDTTDRVATYKPGDTATFSIEAPFDGEVLLAIANEKVHLWDSTASTTNRRATVGIPIDPQWAGKSFYALATVFRRNTDGTPARGPARAVGALYFAVDLAANRQIRLSIGPRGAGPAEDDNEIELRPNRPVSLTLRSDNLNGPAWATVYAIDEGLLSLTNHPSPDPYRRIFGQRQLPISLLDNYGRILLQERSGGDRSRRLLLSNYISDRIIARYVGPVQFINGAAEVTFSEPFDFNGSLRLMAVAWTADKVGAASRNAVMRQRIVSELRMPRSIASGDRVNVALTVRGLGIEPGQYRVSVTPRAPLRVDRITASDGEPVAASGAGMVELDLKNLHTRTMSLALVAPAESAPGMSSVEVRIEGVDAAVRTTDPIMRRFDVALRPARLPSTEMAFLKLAPSERVTLDKAGVADMTAGRYLNDRLTMRMHAGNDLRAILKNYGPTSQDFELSTLERLVWRGMALLHGEPNDSARLQLREIVREVQALQGRDGYFVLYRLQNETGLNESEGVGDRTGSGLRRIEQSAMWRTALAVDFLLQARTAGLAIGQAGLHHALRTIHSDFKSALRKAHIKETGDFGEDRKPELAPVPSEATRQMIEDKDGPPQVAAVNRSPRSARPATARLQVVSPEERMKQRAEREKAAAASDAKSKDKGKDADDSDSGKQGGAAASDPADTSEHDEDIVDDNGPNEKACREDHLYAAVVLAQTDSIDRIDLDTLAQACGATNSRPLGTAILAAALQRYGLQREAKLVLASLDTSWGATASSEPDSDPDGRFDAMMLAFLGLADAPAQIRNELSDRLLTRQSTARPLSVAVQVWVMRAYAALSARMGDAENPIQLASIGNLPTARRTSSEVVGEWIEVDRLAPEGITLRNDGSAPVYVAVMFRGVLNEKAPGPTASGLKVERKILNLRGEDVIAGKLPVRPNDLLYVLLEGERQEDEDDAKSNPVIVIDGIASGFEIVDKDVFELARGAAGVNLRSVLPSDGRIGRLRMVEARDDALLAIVRPSGAGKFRIGYTVRVISPGEFVLPGTLVEDLRRSEISIQTPLRAITISDAR